MSMIAKLNHEVSRFHRRLIYSNCNTSTNSSSLVHKVFHCAAVKDIPINSRINPNLAINNDSVSGKRNDGIVWKQYEYNKCLPQNKPIITLQSFRMTTTATTTTTATDETNASTKMKKETKRRTLSKFIPRKAAVAFTDKARNLFKKLLENRENKDGILLKLQQSTTGQPRMVFTFGFAKLNEIGKQDEGYVSTHTHKNDFSLCYPLIFIIPPLLLLLFTHL